jgi:Double-stranded RNA binding motif
LEIGVCGNTVTVIHDLVQPTLILLFAIRNNGGNPTAAYMFILPTCIVSFSASIVRQGDRRVCGIIVVDGVRVAMGKGRNKKAAKHNACENWLIEKGYYIPPVI